MIPSRRAFLDEFIRGNYSSIGKVGWPQTGGLIEVIQEAALSLPYPARWLGLNLYGWVLRIRRFGRSFWECYRWLSETQWWPTEEIKRWQANQLGRLLADIREHVPYYETLLSDRFKSEPITECELERIPLLTKDVIRHRQGELLSRRLRELGAVRRWSSGTTGQKLEFYLPRQLAYGLNSAIIWRQYSWAGVRPWDRRATLGGRRFTRRSPYVIYNSAENQLLLSAHHLNQDTVCDYIAALMTFRPVFIQGHPTVIALLASAMLARGVYLPLRAVFTTGETLEPDHRQIIEQVFRTKVFESYGLGESVVAAQECEFHTGFHEVSELGIIELIPAATQHGYCYVVGTSLWNNVMPFIRYQIEDLVEPVQDAKCPCGRGLPLRFQRIVGRVDDVIRGTDGKLVLPVTVRMAVKPVLRPFENYQLRQIDQARYEFLLQGSLDEARSREIRRVLRDILGEGAEISVDVVDRLITPGGKVRNVVNLTEPVRLEV